MGQWTGCRFTQKGLNLQAKAEAGRCELKITKMKIGDGQIPAGTELTTLTDLVNPRIEFTISEKEALDGGIARVNGVVTNLGLAAGFYIRELGIFAEDPDEGVILLAINTDTAPDWLAAESVDNLLSYEFETKIAIGQATKFTAQIDLAALATIGHVKNLIAEHDNSDLAHKRLFDALRERLTGFEYDPVTKTLFVPDQAAAIDGKTLILNI